MCRRRVSVSNQLQAGLPLPLVPGRHHVDLGQSLGAGALGALGIGAVPQNNRVGRRPEPASKRIFESGKKLP